MTLAEHRTWAVVDDAGYLEGVIRDAPLLEACEAATHEVGADVVLDTVYEEDVPTALPLAANVPGPALPIMPRKAHVATTLPRLRPNDVMTMTVAEAHARIVGYFPTERGEMQVTRWQDPDLMVAGFLRDNYKQQKSHPRRKALIATGLPLAPNAIAFQRMGRERGPSRRLPQGEQRLTLCAGSNDFCRGSCLVYTGQHGADPYNLDIKVATTIALLEEPAAFMRILVEAIERFGAEQRQCRKTPCYRLNVLSDIPWELVYPELFTRFARSQFYDYTKVAGRVTPDNYDLTFSYSGTNWKGCQSELEAGRRVAVVFFARRGSDYPLPQSFRGYRVIDGTTHDFRFTDPGRIIVGLRYLTPSTQLLTTTPKRSARALAARYFLVPCWEEDGAIVAAETPRAADAFWFGEEG